ncbi:MAG: bifunctional transaldolase/phosoglucose isomerase [Anaerolineaceae bacterium]|nr:bifunctional transaldolase/phosoglucose isomerase [Anaerolineaceae bacterium]
MNNSQALKQAGQSIWYDNIERTMLRDGFIAKMIQDGKIYGITSNPSIFENALSKSSAYNDVLQSMAWSGMNRDQIYFELIKEDIQAAADLFRHVYVETDGLDGLVSVEIDPFLAHDTKRSIEEGKALWAQINRKNLMIKVPATREGMEVVRELISAGINVNATLIFSLDQYYQVIDAYLQGLEERVAAGERVDSISSVASFFISRIDSAVDSLLDQKIAESSSTSTQASQLKGKIAIATAKLAYKQFIKMFGGERFEELKANGARLQRLLWASTGTKNPTYTDTLYVDELIAENTINTVPPQTLKALLDHGNSELSIGKDLDEAYSQLNLLNDLGIDLAAVMNQLEKEGVEKFQNAHTTLLDLVDSKRKHYAEELDGLSASVQSALRESANEVSVGQLFAHEPTYWTTNEHGFEEIRKRLGWLGLPSQQFELIPELEEFRNKLLEDGFTDAFVLGMGGSSLAPEVISQAISPSVPEGQGLRLQIIDTTNPKEILYRTKDVDLRKTLFIVSSKSGGTSETMSAYKYFWQELAKLGVENIGQHFVAVTDPGTTLQILAEAKGFRKVFNARPDVGGRYSVFTKFGLVPAAVMGVNLHKFLSAAKESELQSREKVAYPANPNLLLGLVLGEASKAGKDKLTFIAEKYTAHLVPWLEQLIAESSGKEGKGIIPIEAEPLLESLDYPQDRFFVYFSVDGEKADVVQTLLEKGHPVIEIEIKDPYMLAREFYRWEYATAVACASLNVNAFDQPNVQLSKTITKDRITEYQEKGSLNDGTPIWENEEAVVYGDPVDGLAQAQSLLDVIKAYGKTVEENGYFALNAFVPRLEENEKYFQNLRKLLLNEFNKATTLGFGPRFLHSTGQLHKGGQTGGLFFTFTKDGETDFEIPGEGMSFATLQRAQALGDIEALKQKGRRVVRVHLK